MDEQLLIAKVKDALRLRDSTGMFKAVGFLSESEASFIASLDLLKGEKYAFWGGYDEAQRVFFVALPDWCDSPENIGIINSFTFNYRSCYKLSHRDFLGTLMSLGIKRESVGDILIEEGRAVVFTFEGISDYVLSQINKVGGVGVTINKGHTPNLPSINTLKDFTDTVASTRLDSVIASLMGTSREKAKEAILEKRVSVNSVLVDKITFLVPENAKISIRGIGRFIICDCSSLTKKGRIVLNYKKYV